jgi:hypothetical protein
MQEAHPPMLHPQYPLLNYDYDKDHRAAHMEYGSTDEQLPLLKPHTYLAAQVGRALRAVHTACRFPRACPCGPGRSSAPEPRTS